MCCSAATDQTCSESCFSHAQCTNFVYTSILLTHLHTYYINNCCCTVCSLWIFGPPEGGPILFLLSPEVSGTSGTMSIYIYIYIYIYMSTTWRTRSRYVIFRLYFGKIHSFASDFISEESFRPEEFFEDDFQAIRVSRAVGGPRVF